MPLIVTFIPPKNVIKMSRKDKFVRKVSMKFHYIKNQQRPISGYLNPALQVGPAR